MSNQMSIWDIINEENINSMRPVRFQILGKNEPITKTYQKNLSQQMSSGDAQDIVALTHNFALNKEDIVIVISETDGSGNNKYINNSHIPSYIKQLSKKELEIGLGDLYSNMPTGSEIFIKLLPSRY